MAKITGPGHASNAKAARAARGGLPDGPSDGGTQVVSVDLRTHADLVVEIDDTQSVDLDVKTHAPKRKTPAKRKTTK